MDFNLSPLNKMVIKTARAFCETEIPEIDAYMKEHKDYPPHLQQIFAKHKMLGMDVPKEHGGIGADNFNLILVAEIVGMTGSTSMLPFFMNNSVAETICHWGTEDVIKRFVPGLCDGTAWASMAFTEPNTGSDPRALTLTAEPDGDEFILNGTKRFISMANKPGPGVFFAKDLSMKGKPFDTTAFIVDKTSPGITFSGHYELMGLDGADTCDVFFKDVRVPKANILGKQGKGFPILLRWIAGERVQQCAATIGGGQAALDESVKYGNQRVVGGFPMGYMQGFSWMLADMKTKVEACRLMCYKTVALQDEKKKGFEAASSELKVLTVPMIQEVCRQAVQFHGSYGYSKEYKVEKLFRNAMHLGVVASSLEINKTIAGMTILTQK